jgi:Yip1 domain
MALITRAKNILLSPATEWLVIDTETATPTSLLGKYVIPMALIPAVAMFIGYGLIGMDAGVFRVGGLSWGLIMACNSFITSIIGYFISTYVIDALAPSFNSPKNAGKSAQLVAYSYTAAWVAGIFNILPSLGILGILGLYGIYLFYLGIPVMKKTPEDKRVIYMIVSAIVIIVVSFVVGLIVTNIIYAITGNPWLPAAGLRDSRWR